MKLLDFGKYKGIIISIALFLLLDASVLILNFFISFQISEDAVGVNIAGRQRMLSQRTMKSLLDTRISIDDASRPLAELSNTVKLFDTTLTAFDIGGETPGADGNNVQLAAVSSDNARAAVDKAKTLWKPYYQEINTLLTTAPTSSDYQTALNSAIKYGSENNLQLLKLMNDLTVELESVASSNATTLRLIQTAGILLAVTNFFIIMFHFMRQLRESDQKIEAAQQETREILETVNEGLFLVDQDLVIGAQHSTELRKIFSFTDIAGQNFEALLKDLVSEKDMKTTQSFIKLLFKPNVNQNLIGDLNPLSEIEIHIPKTEGGYENKHLSFSFSRVVDDEKISHVLVTVVDISDKVKLAKELAAAQTQNEQQLELLSSLLSTNSELLPMFLDNAFLCFNHINNELQQPAKSHAQYIQKANRIYALIHNFKGESSALNLQQFSDLAHEFEDELDRVKAVPDLSGKHFLALTIKLNNLISKTEQASELGKKLRHFTHAIDKTQNQNKETPMDWSHLNDMALTIADKLGKQVAVTQSGLSENLLPPSVMSTINSLSIQFIRNAVSHGIEAPAHRQQSQKHAVGAIDIRLAQNTEGNFIYEFSDDGSGLDLDAIRLAALKKGLISETEAETLDKKKIISLIFSPELSTSDTTDVDAGRGMGMHAIRSLVKELNGKISISTRRGLGCKFTITIPKQTVAISSAA